MMPLAQHVGRRRRRIGTIALGAVILFWSMVPIYWGLVVSFSTTEALYRQPTSFFPQPFTLHFYRELLNGSTDVSRTFLSSIRNSVIQASAATAVTVAIALPAAYGFTRLAFRGAKLLLSVLVLTLAMPIYLVIIPLFQTASGMGLINTHVIIVAIYTAAAMPLAVWILRSHIASLPPDIESAARLDGASTVQVLLKIVWPLVAPGAVSAAVVVFLMSWGAFLVPAVFANSPDVQPVTAIIPQYVSRSSSDLGLKAAAGMLAIIPPALLVALLHRRLLSGLLHGASK